MNKQVRIEELKNNINNIYSIIEEIMLLQEEIENLKMGCSIIINTIQNLRDELKNEKIPEETIIEEE